MQVFLAGFSWLSFHPTKVSNVELKAAEKPPKISVGVNFR